MLSTRHCLGPVAQRRPLAVPSLRNRTASRVVCFQEGASSAAGANTRIAFEIPLQTAFGERVAVVGSFTGWDPATPLKLEWSEGNLWHGEVEVPAGEPLEYKYIISKGDAVTWQPGRNLVLTLSEGAQAVLVLDDWLGKKHEVKSSTAKEEAEVAAQGAEAAVVELVAAVNSIAANGVAAVLETQLPVPAEQEQAFQAAEATPTDEKQQEEEGPEAAAMTATEDGTAPLLANETLTKPAAAAPKAASVSMPAVAAAAVSSLQATTAQLKATALRARDKAPSAAMPVVALVVCVALVAAALDAVGPLVAGGLAILRQRAATVLHFVADSLATLASRRR